MSDPCRFGVLGVGDVLMGDDGIGPFIVKILESRYEFPENVVLSDLGTPDAPAIAAVLAELRRLGISAKLRPEEVAPSIWWTEDLSCGCPARETPNVPGHSW